MCVLNFNKRFEYIRIKDNFFISELRSFEMSSVIITPAILEKKALSTPMDATLSQRSETVVFSRVINIPKQR